MLACLPLLGLSVDNPLDYVDPLVGSNAHGHVFVGACVPLGMVQLGPLNWNKGWDWCSGYHYTDKSTKGFAHTHLSGTGCADMGDILIMPYISDKILQDPGNEDATGGGYGSRYAHDDERVSPGYYRTVLQNGQIEVELTATERAGFHRYTFPDSASNCRVIVDLGQGNGDSTKSTSVTKVDAQTFQGFRNSDGWGKNQLVNFALQVDKAPDDAQIFDNRRLVLTYTRSPGILQLRCGISPNSPEKALANLWAEMLSWDFDKVRQEARDKWRAALSVIDCNSKNVTTLRSFYTALYHFQIHPSLFSDAGDATTLYTQLSLWDTYRCAHPLFTIVAPSYVKDFVASFMALYAKDKTFPIWQLWGYETGTMPGISSIQVACEAIVKRIPGIDVNAVWSAVDDVMRHSTIRGLPYIRDLKFVPSDVVGECIGQAFELSVGFGHMALAAKSLGKADDAAWYAERAATYPLYWDPDAPGAAGDMGFFRGKLVSGQWHIPWDPLDTTGAASHDYTEGNAYSYLFFCPQDAHGLITLFGGEDEFVSRLDQFFTIPMSGNVAQDLSGLIGQYAHGDEHAFHILWLYLYAGQQWKTADRVRFVLENFYPPTIEGLIGNEDCGAMSAWMIVACLGFYPVMPASGEYVFGTPAMEEMTINLESGAKFLIRAPETSSVNRYIQSVTFNGQPYTKSYITHTDIMAGGELIFEMGPEPNKNFGAAEADRPHSSMKNL